MTLFKKMHLLIFYFILVWSQTESRMWFQTRFCTSFSSFASWAPWRWRPQRAQTSSMRPWDRSWQREPFTTSSGWPSLICSSRVKASSELLIPSQSKSLNVSSITLGSWLEQTPNQNIEPILWQWVLHRLWLHSVFGLGLHYTTVLRLLKKFSVCLFVGWLTHRHKSQDCG